MNNQKGQNIIEYILLSVAVILVFIVILKPNTGPLAQSVNRTLNSTSDKLDDLNANTIIFNNAQ